MKKQLLKALTLIFTLALVFALPMSAEKYKTGDMNSDGEVNSDDAIHLLRHVLLPEKYPVSQAADLNGDGKVTTNDAIRLLRHTTAPETYPIVCQHNYENGVCTHCGDENSVKYSEGLEFVSNGDGTCYVSGIGTCTDTDLVIPNKSPTGDSVTRIGEYAFSKGDGEPTSVIIPNSVISIGEAAFSGCISLTNIIIPDSVTSIGSYAFDYCTDLTSITVDENNKVYKSIDGNLYTKDGSELIQYTIGKTDASFIIPDSVTSVVASAFASCQSLTSVTIPDSVTSIGSYAFSNCNKLVEVINKSSLNITKGSSGYGYVAYYALEVHNGESKIVNKDGYLFYSYNGVNCLLGYVGNDTDLKLPESYNGENYQIYKYAFYCCDNLTGVTIPDSVTSIESKAFYACHNLPSVTIGNGVTTIGDNAFYYCTGLTSVTIGSSVTRINNNAFYICDKLVEVINKSNQYITKGSKDNGYVACYALEVHNGESKIVNKDDYLFYTYNGVNYLLGYVGSDTELVLPQSYNGQNYQIYKYAFSGCNSLTSVTIPESATSIGDLAFSECTGLTSVTIGNSVTSIGRYAFSFCTSLTSIVFEDTSAWYVNGIQMDVTNDSTNAEYLKYDSWNSSTGYADYYWYKE